MFLFNVLRKRMSKKNNTPENMHCLVCVYKLFVNNIKKNDVTPFFINTSNKDKLTILERPPLIEIYNILRNIDRSDN